VKPRLTLLVLSAALIGWLFAPALSGRASFAFRDAAHFYHPLFEYIRSEWGSGRLPLWNPHENLGGPLIAENTTSVFYPGKLLFLLPLDYTWLYNVYIVGHVALAVGTAYLLARRLNASRSAATLAGLAYAFSGSVLAQSCNVVFLVGAAWLPAAMLLVDRMLRERRLPSALGFGAVLALMVTGGDPHMAYHAALLSAIYALGLWWSERSAEPDPSQPSRPRIQTRPALLAVAAVVAFGLAAVQVLPTLEAGPHSKRSRYDAPRNVYELAGWAVSSQGSENYYTWYEGLIRAEHAGHHGQVYQFSVAPPAFLDLIWPNFTGYAFPTDSRWLRIFNAEDRIWVPSLYLGLAPLLLAVSAWSLRRAASFDVRFWSLIALVTAVASFGMYGFGYLARQMLGTPFPGIGDETGGLYWLMVVVLPFYVQFRYPAKLFVITSLALALLAARGWDSYWQDGRRRVLALLAFVPVASGVVLYLMLDNWQQIIKTNPRAQYSQWLGPFDWSAAWQAISGGLIHAAVAALVLLAVFWFGRRQPRFAPWMQTAVLALTALDLAITQQRFIEFGPAELWTARPPAVDMLEGQPQQGRLYRQPSFVPESWARASSPQRHVEWVEFDRATLLPKYPLPYGISMAESDLPITAADVAMVLEAARLQNKRIHQRGNPEDSVLDLLGARFAIVDIFSRREVQSPREVADQMYLGDRPGALPRAWIVHQVETIPPITSRSLRTLRRATLGMLFPDNNPRDWRRIAVVEAETQVQLPAAGVEQPGEESCRIVRDEPSRVEIEATLATGGLVVLSDQHYPGWRLTVETGGASRPAKILRTNRVMRGVVLPQGSHRLVYTYRPMSVLLGAAISLASLVALGVFAARQTLGNRGATNRRVAAPES